MVNEKIKIEIFKSGISHWELAEVLGMSESTLSRRLRKPLSAKEETEFLEAIKEIKSNGRI